MVPGSPPIDVFSDFSITENKKAGTLSVSGKLTGDNFSSTEAFISDPSGKNLFIGVGFYEGSPFSSFPPVLVLQPCRCRVLSPATEAWVRS
jgi:hypothetical protein